MDTENQTGFSLNQKQEIGKQELLARAGELMKECDDYIDGIIATDVKEVDGSFVFSGDYFLKPDGTPSEKTLAVFNVFKFLNSRLSRIYRLKNSNGNGD